MKKYYLLYLSILSFMMLITFCEQYMLDYIYADGNNIMSKMQKFNFVAAGDFGCGDEPNRTIDGIVRKNPHIVLALGDLSYKKSANCWLNTVIPLGIDGIVKIAFGEHDLNNKLINYNEYMRHFNMTKPFYSFNYQNVHFLAMATAKNSIIPYENQSEQYDFVEQDLMNAHNNKSVEWIITHSFRPFYSSFTAHSGQQVLPEIYHPLFDKYGVDIVLQGHNHNYQRTFPLRYNGSSYLPLFHPSVVDKHRTEYEDPKEQYFLQ